MGSLEIFHRHSAVCRVDQRSNRQSLICWLQASRFWAGASDSDEEEDKATTSEEEASDDSSSSSDSEAGAKKGPSR